MSRRRLFCVAALLATFIAAAPGQARETVPFKDEGLRPGTIVVKTKERKLYLLVGDGQAIRYPVAVGRRGKQWSGAVRIDAKYVEPAWSPPEEIRRDNPKLPDVIPGGAPSNPMGARAMTLSGGGQYAIHGTNAPKSIGTFASYGCVRMHNDDIIDLYARVRVGASVVMQP
ncbi:L,D-transpeptidase [Ancylobacter sp. A5.8]|uniref:L,D-transpeptidase n=1 Tax=Ancylobacter gelatini TaxID=2919920 RepID=UPI001F4D5E37|nr:L,D-transpeptidase [Ancylobacter gelatini]MCJ8142796.1 L,D-transpeptidase [Ancylobacter gelatini]